jgi:hypothetical protein
MARQSAIFDSSEICPLGNDPSMRIVRKSLLTAMGLLAAALGICLGCGSNRTTIEGAVTFDGQPVEQGAITFEPASGAGPSAGGTIQSSRYKVNAEGVTPGEMIVRISAVRPTGKKVEAGPPEPPGKMVDEVRPYIPAMYNEKSRLTVQVTAGKVTQDFTLKSQPPGH